MNVHSFDNRLQEQYERQQLDERNELIEELNNSPIADKAMRQAQKYLRKNKAEWKRLHAHAEAALLSNNKAQYSYAIKKMRKMLKQPYTDDLIDTMWRTSRESVRNIFLEAMKDEKIKQSQAQQAFAA